MAGLADLVVPGAIAADVTVSARKPLLTAAGRLAARAYGLDAPRVTERLVAREREGSTGFGAGVAIPHCRVDDIARPLGLLLRLTEAVGFYAVDGLPVDLAFVLLSPPGGGSDHLKTLARVSRTLRDQAFVAKLRGAGSADALYALLAGDDAA